MDKDDETNPRKRRKASNCQRVFLPQRRMRAIRWEESVANSHIKRDPVVRKGKVVPHHVVHHSCACGSIDCLANVMAVPTHVAGGNEHLWGDLYNEYGSKR